MVKLINKKDLAYDARHFAECILFPILGIYYCCFNSSYCKYPLKISTQTWNSIDFPTMKTGMRRCISNYSIRNYVWFHYSGSHHWYYLY